ncbi:nitrate- and nitrite sensing domain-containing protein [Streptomyces sp. NPDC059176]|uniref:sensor histidine kinase n=1 Tax=unclassified Streptomyces TaxID=2593676 RepID=UPI0036A540E8
MQKKRPRGKSGKDGSAVSAGSSAPQTPATGSVPAEPSDASRDAHAASGAALVPGGRPVRVRRRLVAGVAAVSLTVVVAGAPAVLAASADLTESQRLVSLAELNRQAVTLAHSLADERDEVTAYVAAGREGQKGDEKGRLQISGSHSTRVDRQIDEIRGNVTDDHAELRRGLAAVPSVRRAALTGKGTALEAHRAYSEVISGLQALAEELAEKTPPRAADGTRAPAALALAVEQASATRGLLLAALSVPAPRSDRPAFDPVTGQLVEDQGDGEDDRARDALSSAAQQARVREQAALVDFDQTASSEARDRVTATITGPEVKAAETYLARLTDQPQLSEKDRKSDREKVESALSARIEQMRGAQSALSSVQVEQLGQLRDDDVSALELRVALLGGCLLVAVGVSAAVARTLTRPLAVLRIGAARLAAAPEAEEPIRFTGRNDEFAQVVRSLNTVHGKLLDLGSRTQRLHVDRGDLAAAREELTAQRGELQQRTAEVSEELEQLRHTVSHTFVNLALRTLGLVERQLGVIEKLEEREQDPERLATFFKLDHMATVMRRHSENLLVLAGAEHGQGHAGPVPLVDVMRAAVSEIERYERVTIQSLPPHSQIAGFAADDLSHLVAELLENATSFSPPDAQVQLSGWLLESGEVMLSVQDEGIGMTPGRLEELNARLAHAQAGPEPDGEGLGLRVAALLAGRHGVQVQLREQKQGGIAAVVVLPQSLLPTGPPTATPQTAPVPGAAPVLNLPGSVAEANSNLLGGRSAAMRDPVVSAAEMAVARAAATSGPEAQFDEGPRTGVADAAVLPSGEDGIRAQPAEEQEDGDLPAAPAPSLAGIDPEPPAATGEPEPEPAAPAERWTDADPQPQPAAGGPEPLAATSRPDAPTGAPHDPEHLSTPDGVGPESLAADHEPAVGPSALADGPDVSATTGQPVHDEPAPGPETTLQVRLPHPRPEPDTHERVTDGTAEVTPEPVTDKGLPKRTPKSVAPPEAPRPRATPVDAEELRRRLGGFHQGAKDGRRDVEAELADTTRSTHSNEQKAANEEPGDTVEEARH